MKVKINQELRKLYADKTFDLTNLGASALLVGQFFSKDPVSWEGIVVALVLVIAGYMISYVLYRGGEKQ